eukprot:372468-Rhodomonas_salina.3
MLVFMLMFLLGIPSITITFLANPNVSPCAQKTKTAPFLALALMIGCARSLSSALSHHVACGIAGCVRGRRATEQRAGCAVGVHSGRDVQAEHRSGVRLRRGDVRDVEQQHRQHRGQSLALLPTRLPCAIVTAAL